MLPSSIGSPISTTDSSRTGLARRQSLSLAKAMGFSELRQGQVGIIVTEAAANIFAHGGEGEVLLIPWQFREEIGIDVLALDRGKGIADVARCVEDGYSTAGTAGQGLGAISRLASTFQIYSQPGHGTALFARVLKEGPPAVEGLAKYNLGVVSLAVAGETHCGDTWSAAFSPSRSIYIVADGLGHGLAAAEASRAAVRIFDQAPHLPPEKILAAAHSALGNTRGAAISIAEVLHDKGVVNYAGVGNIAAAVLCAGKTRSMVSMNGTIGHSVPKIQTFTYAYDPHAALIMHSDGLSTRWQLEQYPALASHHPALLAGVLYRDFCRRRDDVTIFVSRVQT